MPGKRDNFSKDDELALDAAEMAGDRVPTLDLHGKRLFEAESELDQFLHHQYMEGNEAVKIIHGFGTGALKNAINKILSDHPLVRIYRTSRDGGAAIAVLEDKN